MSVTKIRKLAARAVLGVAALAGPLAAIAAADAPGTLLVFPSSAPNTEAALVTVTGTDMLTVTGMRLQREGRPDIPATGMVVSPTTILASFAVTDESPGPWDLEVTNPDGSGMCSGCFTVTADAPGAPVPAPEALQRGWSARDVTLRGTNFFPGVDVTFSGTGITLNDVTYVDTTELIVNISIAADAPKTLRTITAINTDGRSGACVACFAVISSPTLDAVTPATRGQGATNQVVSLVGSAFAEGASVSFSGSGVSTTSTAVLRDAEMQATIEVARAAPIGARDVRVTNPDGGTVVCEACFSVTAGPTVVEAIPVALPQGMLSSDVAIVGSGFEGTPTVTLGDGVDVLDVAVDDASHLALSVAVDADAAAGARTVTVVNPDGGKGECVGCFTVSAAPDITAVTPGARGQGAQAQDVTITVAHLVDGATVAFDGTGISVNAVSRPDAATLIANVDVALAAPAGARTVTVTNPDGGTGSCVACFIVNQAPSLTGISPSILAQGVTTDLAVTGANFTPATTVAFSHPGIALDAVHVADAEHLTATVSVDPAASVAASDVSVDNGDGGVGGSCAGCVSINAAPVLEAVSPDALGQGVIGGSLTLTGSNFQDGAIVSFAGSGITITDTMFVDASELIAVIDVAPDAPIGVREVTVTNPDLGTTTCEACFEVNAAPTITTVSPGGARPGSSDLVVTITGADFQDGASVAFAGSGITVDEVTFVATDELRAQIDIALGAATDGRDVRVTNPDHGTASCAGCFVVATSAVVSDVIPDSRGQGATGADLTIIGFGFEPDATVAFSDAGVSVGSVSYVSQSELAVVADVAADAIAGARDVVVTNPALEETAACTSCFTVNPAPVATSSDPAVLGQGASGRTIHIRGQHFQPSAIVELSAAGLTLSDPTFVGPEEIVATVDVDRSASPGPRSIIVTNPDGGTPAVCQDCLIVGAILGTADLNGDGIADVAIGAPDDTINGRAGAGSVSVIYGGSGSSQLWHRDQPGVRGSARRGDAFGTAIVMGDFDRDGFADLAVGAPGDNLKQTRDVGSVTVLYGAPGGLDAARDQLWHSGTPGVKGRLRDGAAFGAALATGDFDGDGFADLSIGAPGDIVDGGIRAGGTHVLYGSTSGLTPVGDQRWHRAVMGLAGKPVNGAAFGAALATGDLNGDGFSDLSIGAPGDRVRRKAGAGSVNILYGRARGLSVGRDQLWHRASGGVNGSVRPDAAFGSALATGDLNGDGFADLAIGVPGDRVSGRSGAGALNVLYGADGRVRATRDQLWHRDVAGIAGRSGRYDAFGSALATGDFDGDGFGDLAIGAPGDRVLRMRGAGSLNVIYGRWNGLDVRRDQLWRRGMPGVRGRMRAGDAFAYALNAQDLNGDGVDDLAIGTPGDDRRGMRDAGSATVLFGSSARLSAEGSLYVRRDDVAIEGEPSGGARLGAA